MVASKSEQVLAILSKLYPQAQSELVFENEYQLFVSVLLSAQCTDKKVNEVSPRLFARYPDFKTLASARLKSLEKIIRPVNYYITKASHLIKSAKLICELFGGSLPPDRAGLMSLPGVGQKTANVILGELGVEHSLPVDTHVFRVSKRLGLAGGKNVLEVEEELKVKYASTNWRLLHHGLIFHGRRVCSARKPLCAECALSKVCSSAFKF